jgi:hypothetical protein
MKPESVFEELLFTTVRIEAKLLDGSQSTGTSFIFSYGESDKNYLFLVTNKHVIENAVEGTLLFNREENGQPALGNVVGITLSDFEKRWIGHPRDDVDVAIMPFVPVLNELSGRGARVFIKAIQQDLIPSDEQLMTQIDAVEDVVFIGYPNDIFDRKNLLPVVRRGITATPASVDFEGKPAFLIDASIFPGSSGSPVLLCNIGSYSPKGKGLHVGSRILFMGVVASVFIRRDINTIEIVDIPTQKLPIVQTSQMVDLGIVYKARVIQGAVEEFLAARGLA